MANDPPVEAFTAAIEQAATDRSVWKPETFEQLLQFMQSLGPDDPSVTRAGLIEIWVEGNTILAVQPPSAHLTAGRWHARQATVSGVLTLIVLLVVDATTYSKIRGIPPDQWSAALA